MKQNNQPRIKPALLELMGDKEWTLRELEMRTGFTFDAINHTLRKMQGQAYICGWQPQRRAVPCAVWKLGQGEHAPKLPPRHKKWYPHVCPIARDEIRLKQPYFNTETRLPWELVPCR
jgi:hypothetical protein